MPCGSAGGSELLHRRARDGRARAIAACGAHAGGRMAGGAARGAVSSLVAARPRVSFFRTPPVPRAAPAGRLASPGRGLGMEEVTDEPLYRDRVCGTGIGIGKAEMYATIRVPSEKNPARRASETRGFATTRRGVLGLADWMRSWQVPALVMEATGGYWKGPFCRLEAEGFECVLAGARKVKNLPGRPKRPAGLGVAGGLLRTGRGHLVFRAHAGVPAHPAAHPLRRTLIAARISGTRPAQPTNDQIRVVLAAWEAAAA